MHISPIVKQVIPYLYYFREVWINTLKERIIFSTEHKQHIFLLNRKGHPTLIHPSMHTKWELDQEMCNQVTQFKGTKSQSAHQTVHLLCTWVGFSKQRNCISSYFSWQVPLYSF